MVHRYALAARATVDQVWLICTGHTPGPGMAHLYAVPGHGARARYGSCVRVGARAATPVTVCSLPGVGARAGVHGQKNKPGSLSTPG